jgi:Domain of unknown function (DUF4386)
MAATARWARIAGACWLVAIVTGFFAEGLVRSKLIADDPATTIANILSNEGRYRLASVAMFVGTAAYLVLTVILYRLFAPVSRTVSLIAAMFSVIGCTAWMLTLVTDSAPLVPADGTAATTAVIQALLALHGEFLLLGMFCFGLQCLLLGGLITRATFIPKWLGIVLGAGGAGYVTAELLHLLAPDVARELARWTFLPGELAELLLGSWLTIAGVNSARWNAVARAPV